MLLNYAGMTRKQVDDASRKYDDNKKIFVEVSADLKAKYPE